MSQENFPWLEGMPRIPTKKEMRETRRIEIEMFNAFEAEQRAARIRELHHRTYTASTFTYWDGDQDGGFACDGHPDDHGDRG